MRVDAATAVKCEQVRKKLKVMSVHKIDDFPQTATETIIVQ